MTAGPPPADTVHGTAWRWLVVVLPVLAIVAVVAGIAGRGIGGMAAAGAILVGAVIAAVHHAELVAHRVGEPFGTLVLAVAVTVIEVSLIVSLMLSDPLAAETLARDTVFAAIMLILDGIVGACLLVGAIKHHAQRFSLEGAFAALNVLAAMAVLSLVLPSFVRSAPGPEYAPSQLVFVAIVSVALYATFVLVQTVRHRDYFLPVGGGTDEHSPPPAAAAAWRSAGLLVLALVGVVFLAKGLSPAVKAGVAAAGLPIATVGIVIAALVLAPESVAAVRAARADRLQTSLNLALGSALASIGLTIPAVAVASLVLGIPLALGIAPSELVLLILSLFASTLSLGTGRTTVLAGAVHLVIFAAYLFMTVVP